MSGLDRNVIRFAAGNADDIRSSIWRLWGNGNDLYLAARAHAHISKISFHASGINRYAINEGMKYKDDLSDRALYKWNRLEEFTPGWTSGFAIVIPPRITKSPFLQVFKKKKLTYFVKPHAGHKITFQIILSHKAARPEHLEKLLSMKIKIHGYIKLDREFAWLISYYEKFTPKDKEIITDHFNKLKIHLKPGDTGEGLSNVFLHVVEMDKDPFLNDIELGKENLENNPS